MFGDEDMIYKKKPKTKRRDIQTLPPTAPILPAKAFATGGSQ